MEFVVDIHDCQRLLFNNFGDLVDKISLLLTWWSMTKKTTND